MNGLLRTLSDGDSTLTTEFPRISAYSLFPQERICTEPASLGRVSASKNRNNPPVRSSSERVTFSRHFNSITLAWAHANGTSQLCNRRQRKKKKRCISYQILLYALRTTPPKPRSLPKACGPRKRCSSLGWQQNLNTCRESLDEREAFSTARRPPEERRRRVRELVRGWEELGVKKAELHRARTIINNSVDTRKNENVVYTGRIHPVSSCTKTENSSLHMTLMYTTSASRLHRVAKEKSRLFNPTLKSELRRSINKRLQNRLQRHMHCLTNVRTTRDRSSFYS